MNARGLSAALAVAAVVAVLMIPRWSAEPSVVSRKTDERMEELEADVKRMDSALRGHEARIMFLEEQKADLDATIARVLPPEARWIPMSPGGSDQWDFPVGGRAQVKFLHVDEAGVPVFRIKHRAAEVDVPLRQGQTTRAVDDLGDQQRIYDTSVHRIRLDRNGRPEAALISVTVELR